MGCILSALDGINNYNGIIFVGLTNHFDKIPDNLKRHLRLTPYYFTFLRDADVVSIIEKFYEIKLLKNLINGVPDRKVNPAELKFLCDKYNSDQIDELLTIVKNK